MFNLNKFLGLAFLFALFVNVCSATEAVLEVTEVESKVDETNSENVAILTQLKSKASDSKDAIYTYKCTVGTQRSSKCYSLISKTNLIYCTKFNYSNL